MVGVRDMSIVSRDGPRSESCLIGDDGEGVSGGECGVGDWGTYRVTGTCVISEIDIDGKAQWSE